MLGLTIIIVVMLPLSISLQTIVRQEQTKAENAGLTKTIAYKDSIAPVLKKNCSLCHSEGGKIFDTYPFDRYETAQMLGKRLNTRLKGNDASLVDRWIKEGMLETTQDSTSTHQRTRPQG